MSIPGGGNMSSFLNKQKGFFVVVVIIKTHSTLILYIAVFTLIHFKYREDNV